MLNLRGGYLFDFWTDLRWDHNGTTFQLYAFESIKVEQTVHLLAGQGIQFAADYRSSNTLPGTDQQPFNRVWFEMNGVTLWEENTSTAPLVNDQYTTGWITQTFYASEEGDYTLSFYAEREDQFHHFLLLDDIQIVPEPTTFSLVCLGAVVVAMARRKR